MAILKALNAKKALAAVILGGMAAFLATTPMVSAAGPEFNIFPICYSGGSNCDLPLIDAKNITRGGGYSSSVGDHENGVDAFAGDTLEISIYYHNGTPDTDENVAHNTRIRAMVTPAGTAAQTHSFAGRIWADNATMVQSIDKGGDMEVHIQGGSPLTMTYVNGSAVVERDRGSANPPGPQGLPDTIFDSNGVNIGDVRGCFQFQGLVRFRVQVSSPQVGSLAIQKQVRNFTTGGAFNDVQTNADPGQTVEYKIAVSAASNPVTNVFVRDTLDSRLSYVSGSLTLDGASISDSGFFTSSGVSIDTVNPNVNKELRFRATVAAASQFAVGTTTLPNTAFAFTSSQSVQDNANVIVTISPSQAACVSTWDAPLVSGSSRGLRHPGERFNVRYQVSGLAPNQSFDIVHRHSSGSPVLRSTVQANSSGNYDAFDNSFIPSNLTAGDYNSSIEVSNSQVAICTGFRLEAAAVQQIDLAKTVRNETTSSAYGEVANASPSQRVSFKLVISPLNSNTTLQNVTLRDVLPNKLTFVANSFNVDGTVRSEDGFFGSGINLGSLSPGGQIAVTFLADVAGNSNFTAGSCEDLVNNGTVTSGSLSDSDPATAHVCRDQVTKAPGSPSPRP